MKIFMTSPFTVQPLYFRYRLKLLPVIFLIFIAGLGSKCYTGIGQEWVTSYVGDLLLPLFMILGVALFFPKTSPLPITVGVLSYNIVIEITQLWHAPFLEALRPTLFGKIFLGSYFAWNDIVCYFIGGGLGWWLLRTLQHDFREAPKIQ
jgi:hypothetical protein